MDKDFFLDEILEATTENRKVKGENLANNNKVLSLEGHKSLQYDDVYKISGRVKSENSKRIYDTDIYIDTDTSCAIGANCDCIDFIENSYGECDFFCKHLVATAIKFYQAYKEESREEELASRLKALTVYKEKLKLEVNIEENYYNNNYFSVDFKIGLNKLYVMKNIYQFIEKKLNCESIYYGKNFTYDPCSQEFNDIDEEIVDYIQGIMLLKNRYEYRYGDSFTSGKYLYLSKSLLVTFLKIFRDKKVYYKNKAHRIILGDIPIETSIRRKKDGYTLNIKDNISTVCNAKNVFMFNDNIYIPSKKQADILSIFLDYTLENKLEFNEDKKSLLFNNVLSSLNTICKNVNVDKKITNIINEDLKAKFYLDVKNDDMTLNPVMEYGTEKFGLFGNESDNIVIRDTNKEDLIKEKISELKFILEKNHYIYNGNEDDLYSFLSKDYKEFEKLGEVYYSDKLKNRKIYKKPVINANINDRGMGYLEFDFKIDDIDPKEYQKILAAFKENKKYYKLKDSSFINLEDNKLKAFLNLVDNLNITSENSKFHKNKAIVLNEYINENKLDFIKGKEIVQDINKKLKDIDKLDYTIPKELNATLRDYQIIGYKWLKNISYLEFGGILADEMGLGKTIQAITFILSEKDKKTLIVAPTSLIYNWQSELNKFASSLKVGVVHGSLTDRFKIIKNVKNYDVLLTTYGTLRNDLKSYGDISFDYCFIDEGQNIKNPLSLVSKSVKNINANVKFVLTGTPIENNLLELWSIFDFIMPGYLYSSGTFKKKFINNANSMENLIKHIRPFILRRNKKDVIDELPQKIEKKLYIELSNEQKKIYSTYIKNIQDKMENSQNDKITVFSYLTKLRQLCLDPSVIIDNYKGNSSKIVEAIKLVKEYIHEGHKILLFSQFTSVLKNIRKKLDLEKINYKYLDGQTKASQRLKIVSDFNKSNDCNLFLISLKAGGSGLNLTSADIVIHFDPWWNPSIENQASDRAHRIGQKNVVKVLKLIAKGTIEEKIVLLQEEKSKLIGEVLDNDYESSNILSTLTDDELKELFY